MRWFKLLAAFLVLWIVFYYCSMRSMIVEISRSHATEKLLRQELLIKRQRYQFSKNKSNNKIHIIPITQTESIKYIINKVNDSGFLLEEIYPIKIQHSNHLMMLSFKVVASGGFSQLHKLMTVLSDGNFLVSIDEMVVRDIEKANIKVEMKIDIFNVGIEAIKTHFNNGIDFQWVGYLKKNKNIMALIRMRNGDVHEVMVGSFIDKTAIQVLKLDTQKMLLKLKNRELIITYGQAL